MWTGWRWRFVRLEGVIESAGHFRTLPQAKADAIENGFDPSLSLVSRLDGGKPMQEIFGEGQLAPDLNDEIPIHSIPC